MMEVTSQQPTAATSRSLLGFIPVNKGVDGVLDATIHSGVPSVCDTSEDLDGEYELRVRSAEKKFDEDEDLARSTKTSATVNTENTTMDTSSRRRAANYMSRRRSSLRNSRSEKDAEKRHRDGSYSYSQVQGRIENMFSTTFNQCDRERLTQLRNKRRNEAPIVIYESDDEDENGNKVPTHGYWLADEAFQTDVGMLKSSLQVLDVERRVSMGGHRRNDLTFKVQHIGRLAPSYGYTPQIAFAPNALLHHHGYNM